MIKKILNFLRLPEKVNISNMDDPSTTILHGKIIQGKPFLKKIYTDFYKEFRRSIPDMFESKVLIELGSGGGFLKDIIPNVITSDVMPLPNIDKCFSATNMPFEDGTVDGFFMFDVLHHIHDSVAFFREMNRCLRVGGKVVMIEPANTIWSRFIYKNFQEEDFDTSGRWGFNNNGPLSSSNMAIPWIVFYRDRKRFEKEFSSFKILKLENHTPLRYLISGGLTMRQLLPSFTYSTIYNIEIIVSKFNKYIGMFLTIELEKVQGDLFTHLKNSN